MRILIIEDEKALARLIEIELLLQGFRVELRHDGRSGLACALDESFDLVLLDWMLPDTEGIAICKALRSRGSRVPVIMITARQAVSDEVRGLDAGADDYITKPFDMEQLVARIRAVSRRSGEGSATLACGDVVLHPDERSIYMKEERIHLTAKEFDIFRLLLEQRGKVVSREKMLAEVWGEGMHLDEGAIAVHIKAIRDKLPSVKIENVRGVGYIIPRQVGTDRCNDGHPSGRPDGHA